MKKIISLIVLVFLFNACSLDDSNTPKYTLELLPVESVEIPTEFSLGNTYPIIIHYKRPTTCHYYNGIYYEKGTGDEINVRTIAVENAVLQSNGCQNLTDSIVDCSFNFMPTNTGSYIFKFWHGKDTNGNNTFLQYEIPVN
ncbi:hypothetical protein [Flavobacterium sp. XGLA_31]|uniref:hypothetical protein n=1 Tax=Flavobacterium sp. XGLA_31 TaxID=3447666 RepID=UPI003F2A6510